MTTRIPGEAGRWRHPQHASPDMIATNGMFVGGPESCENPGFGPFCGPGAAGGAHTNSLKSKGVGDPGRGANVDAYLHWSTTDIFFFVVPACVHSRGAWGTGGGGGEGTWKDPVLRCAKRLQTSLESGA